MLRVQTLLKQENQRLKGVQNGGGTYNRISKKLKDDIRNKEINMISDFDKRNEEVEKIKFLLQTLTTLQPMIKKQKEEILKRAYKNPRTGKTTAKKLEILPTIYEGRFSIKKIRTVISNSDKTTYDRIIRSVKKQIKTKEDEMTEFIDIQFKELNQMKEVYKFLTLTDKQKKRNRDKILSHVYINKITGNKENKTLEILPTIKEYKK